MNTISIFASLAASFALVVMAVFILYKDYRDQVNRYFVLWSLSGLGILFSMFLTYYYPNSDHLTFFNKVSQASTVMTFASFLVMALIFPKQDTPYPFTRIFALLVPAAFTSVIILSTSLTINRAYFVADKLERDLNWPFFVYMLIAFSYLIVGLVIFIRKYARTTVRIERLQMRLVFIGSGIALFLATFASIIFPVFFNITQYYVVGPSIAVFFITTALFYSVTSYNLMNIRSVFHRTLLYTIGSAAIIIPIVAVSFLYDYRLLMVHQVDRHILAAFLTIIFIAYAYFVQPRLDVYFKRQQVEFEDLVNKFIRDVYNLQDFDMVINRTLDILHENLYLERSVFMLQDDKGRQYDPVHSQGFPEDYVISSLPRTSELILWFSRNNEILSIDRVYNDPSLRVFKDSFTGFFNDNDFILLLPIYHDQRVLGLICLGQKQSLTAYSQEEITRLEYFRLRSNDFISTAMTYRKAMDDQFVARSVDLASRIQANSIPETLPNMTGIKFGTFLVPRYSIGTDYFDFIRPDNQTVGIISTDISGVGISSSLYSVTLRSAVQSLISEAPSSHTLMQKLNRLMWEYSSGYGAMVTAFYAFYDARNMRLLFTNAGFPPLELFRVSKNDFDSLDTEGIPLGTVEDADFGIGRTTVNRGDIGIIYSKSLLNSKNSRGDTFGLTRLRKIVNDNRARRPVEICEQLKESYAEFMDLATPDSDITVILFKIF